MLKPSLNRYNTQVHSSTKMSPSKTHDHKNALEVKSNLVLKKQHNRKYPSIREGDYVKGDYTSRKKQKVNGLIENIK